MFIVTELASSNIVNDINSKIRVYSEDTGLFILVDNVPYTPRRSYMSAYILLNSLSESREKI